MMKEESPKCSSCGQSMFEIGGVGKDIHYSELHGESYIQGIREQKLYQCPECKEIKIK